MRYWVLLALMLGLVISGPAQGDPDGPKNDKAQKTYKQGLDLLQKHNTADALDRFKKADKQDDGHCLGCQKKIVKYGLQLGDWKAAEFAAQEILAAAHGSQEQAIGHYLLGFVLRTEAIEKHKDELFTRAHDEMTQALTALTNFPDAVLTDGEILAHLRQDDAAKKRFEQYVTMTPIDELSRQRALRFISQPELARARMAPPFSITTTDGQRVSLDELKGKVVLIDFWATWCAPCREALPHMKKIATSFQGQPLVVLSISLDEDEAKWKDFVAKNGMTWLQYRDGGFTGPIATLFAVHAIPQTFTIDSDGVLQDQHIGDASVEGKLKKLLARARELQLAETPKQ